MFSFIKNLAKAFKNLLFFCFILVLFFVAFLYKDEILPYIIHSKSFYQVYLGDKDYKKDNYQEAIIHYKKALELYPQHVKARYNLANIYVAYEDFPSAMEEYKTVIKYDPEYLNARISLGILLSEEVSEFDSAIAQYEQVVNTPKKDTNIPFLYDNRTQNIKAKAIAYHNMGLAYRDKSLLYYEDSSTYKDLLFKAADSYKKALQLIPNNYDSQYNLALTYHLLGLYTEALTGYCKAMLIAPLNYEAHYNFAVLLRQKSLYKESYEEFKDAGSLIVYRGDTFQASYLYNMLNEVSQMAIAEYGFEPKQVMEKMDKEIEENATAIDYEITISELENTIKKRIKTASICKNYLDGT